MGNDEGTGLMAPTNGLVGEVNLADSQASEMSFSYDDVAQLDQNRLRVGCRRVGVARLDGDAPCG